MKSLLKLLNRFVAVVSTLKLDQITPIYARGVWTAVLTIVTFPLSISFLESLLTHEKEENL